MPVVKFERQMSSSARARVAAAMLTWDDVWQAFKRSREAGNYGANKAARGRTVGNYQCDFDKFVGFLRAERGVFHLHDLRDGDIEEYISRVQKRVKRDELSPSSANRVFRSLKALFNFMKLHPETRQVLKDKDMDFKGLLPKIPKNSPRPYVPSQEEVKRFLDAFDKNTRHGLRDYTVASLVASTGLRIGEVCALQIKDIDFKLGQIMVPDVAGQTKTGDRTVPLSVAAGEVIEHWMSMRSKFARPGVHNLFITQYGFPCNQNMFRQSFESHRTRTGLGISDEGNLSPHALRHYFCTMYLVGGGSIQNLQHITGHDSLETLMIYVHMAKQLSHVADEHRRVDPLGALCMSSPGKKLRNR